MKNFFELFGFAPAYALDLEKLDGAYREIQAKIHPDKFAHAGDAERRASMQWTTRVNEAYRTLRNPALRARYLLELNGIDAALETDTAMPKDFLMRQMALRERLSEAKSGSELDELSKDLSEERRKIESQLSRIIDQMHDFGAAKPLVRELMFFERLGEQVDEAYAALQS